MLLRPIRLFPPRLDVLLAVVVLLTVDCWCSPFEGILTSIIRQQKQPDILLPSVCPPACDELFHAVDGSSFNASIGDGCSCRCPPEAPIYLNTAGYCVDKLDECRHNIAFDTDIATEKILPVVVLPAHNGVVQPKTKILWKESGIAVSERGGVNCSITGVFHENIKHRWRASTKRNLFQLLTVGGQTVVMFRGSDEDASALIGAVIQLKISCARFLPDEHCLSFRIAGVSGVNPFKQTESLKTAEIGLVLVLIGMFVFGLLITFIVWQYCWRQKKQRLISDFQMQFLYHFKQQQEAHKAAVAAAHHITSMGDRSPPSMSEFSPSNSPDVSHTQKKRLFFSVDYFDRDQMENPPAMAEQFLFDLRRMIEMARDRIRMRRFVPMLITIPETQEEHRPQSLCLESIEKVEELPEEEVSQESPRSEAKSVDSGRESREDSDDSHEEEVEPKKIETQSDTVKRIVRGFESLSTPSSRLPLPASRLPTRTASKPPPSPITKTTSHIPTLMGQASPRPTHRSLTMPSSPAADVSNKSYRARKGYSVFPANSVLNKSLPRRPKRSISDKKETLEWNSIP